MPPPDALAATKPHVGATSRRGPSASRLPQASGSAPCSLRLGRDGLPRGRSTSARPAPELARGSLTRRGGGCSNSNSSGSTHDPTSGRARRGRASQATTDDLALFWPSQRSGASGFPRGTEETLQSGETLTRTASEVNDAAHKGCVQAAKRSPEEVSCVYRYMFDLRQRQRGLVVATRYEENSGPVAGGEWTCTAPNNAAALELARTAAFAEWPPIAGRAPNDFVVTFVEAAEPDSPGASEPRTKTGVNLKVGTALGASTTPRRWRSQ
jgi:hypothetical protein